MNRLLQVPLLITAPADRRGGRRGEPVTGGVPLPRGVARDDDRWMLTTGDGGSLPLQTSPIDRWPDGSVRWLLVDTQVTVDDCRASVPLTLCLSDGDARSTGLCRVQPWDDGWTIGAGGYAFRIATGSPAVIASVSGPNGQQTYDGTRAEVRVCGATGERWRVEWHGTTVEHAGPMRVATMTAGTATGPGGDRLTLFMRLEFFSGHPVTRIRLTVRNPRRAAHPGGIWELGDAGSILLKELSLVLPAMAGTPRHIRMSAEPAHAVLALHRAYVSQESSGGEHWSSPNHRTRSGTVTLRFRGYELDVDGVATRGLRAAPTAFIEGQASTLGIAVPQFWQNFPRAIEATPSALRVSFFPPEAADVHELQGGEQKTHECFVCFAPDTITDAPLGWCHSRTLLHAMPQWSADCGAIPSLVTAHDEDASYRALADAAVEGRDTFVHKREAADEYGWRNFGDIYGDHEAVRNTSSTPLMSHYNNQYDPIAGFFYQFMRTGDARWWHQCADLAAHVADIDVYHTDGDRAAYNHGLFWHTIHYVDAGKATHRSYPSGTVGGGPSAEHNYTTGLVLHYFASGDHLSREAASDLSRFVIVIDDGRTTPFRYLARGDTGFASASRSFDYHGPGRGSGNSLNALVDGHRLTGDRSFLNKAEQLIRRCSHPHQDIERLALLDPENRWFYTMYLQSLGKYLQWKVECDEPDAMYGYARDVLLHFARWMADHERPYLTRPDLLEFPTETWAAQDIRKSEVFDHAARHAVDAEVARFTERAEFFFRTSIDTLTTMSTRTLARPVVLMLVHGMLRAYARRHGVAPAPAPRQDWTSQWPVYETFVPQKARATHLLKQIAIAGATGLIAFLFAMALL